MATGRLRMLTHWDRMDYDAVNRVTVFIGIWCSGNVLMIVVHHVENYVLDVFIFKSIVDSLR